MDAIDPIEISKNNLRQEIRQKLGRLGPERKRVDSVSACSLLQQQRAWQRAVAVLFYAPTPDEIDVWPLLQVALAQGKTVALPRFDAGTKEYSASELRRLDSEIGVGRYGIREPSAGCPVLPLNKLDLVLVPGVAFDPDGRRLGRGKGYYDRMLAGIIGTTCGVAFDEQVVRRVPVGPHDQPLSCILTPRRWIEV